MFSLIKLEYWQGEVDNKYTNKQTDNRNTRPDSGMSVTDRRKIQSRA